MIVREMKIKDLEEISRIECELYNNPWKEEQYRMELLENKYSYLFVLENEGVIIGYYGFWVMFEDIDITKVSIRKEFQGLKLSNILIEDCFNRARLLDARRINLEVREDNQRAIHLYTNHGFKKISVRNDYYSKGENALVMRKELVLDE